MSKKRYIITCAQSATPVHEGFFKSLGHYPGELLVILTRYKNPTSVWFEQGKDSSSWWCEPVLPFAVTQRKSLCKKLKVYGDIHILPTAKRPLSGWEVFCGSAGGVFGHPKHAMEAIATSSREPRLLLTTGSCTIPNYSDSKAGKHGEAHHIIGAIVVEIDSDGTFFTRQINADKDGCFVDLNKVYTPTGVKDAPNASVLTLGDLHSGTEDPDTLKATVALAKLVRPKYLVLHDVLDFSSANHHRINSIKHKISRMMEGKASVENEVKTACNSIRVMAKLAEFVKIIRSNHDEAFEKFLETVNPHSLDPVNLPYYFAVWNRMIEVYGATGEFPDAFAMEANRLGVPKNVHFLARDEDFTVDGVCLSFHGDLGINGAKGSAVSYSKLGVKTTTGHRHVLGIHDGNFTAGVTGSLIQGYNNLPSSWTHAHVLQYYNGKRTVITLNGDKFRVAM